MYLHGERVKSNHVKIFNNLYAQTKPNGLLILTFDLAKPSYLNSLPFCLKEFYSSNASKKLWIQKLNTKAIHLMALTLYFKTIGILI